MCPLGLGNEEMRVLVLRKNTANRTKKTPCLLLLNAYPINSWCLLDKKGFCEDTLTKLILVGQEMLTCFSQ